jgi:hypothetical protein
VFSDQVVVESPFRGYGFGGGVGAGVSALGHFQPTMIGCFDDGRVIGSHSVAVGAHSAGNRWWRLAKRHSKESS